MHLKLKITNPELYPYGHPKPSASCTAGLDLRTNEAAIIDPGDSVVLGTGVYIALEPGFEAQIRPRSGLAIKHGVTVTNSPGTIDSDYRGEILVGLINHGIHPVIFEKGERVAQMVISRHEIVVVDVLNELPDTERGEGRFGHTGRI